MADSNGISESADVVGKRPCKKGMLTEEQRVQIKIEILVAGGYEELADGAVKNIGDIIEGKVNHRYKKPGRHRLSSGEIDDTARQIRDVQRINPRLQSDRSISNWLKINRRRIVRAKQTMKWRRAARFFRVFGKKYPAPKTILNS